METESLSKTSTDPLKAVADAMDVAVKETRERVDQARTTVAKAIPAAGQFVSRAVYKTSYAISFGVVFPAVLIARSIPQNNALVHGLVDGAHAAVDMAHEVKSKSASTAHQ